MAVWGQFFWENLWREGPFYLGHKQSNHAKGSGVSQFHFQVIYQI